MKDFNISLKKGEIGEALFCSYMQNKGWITYRPTIIDKAHYFDLLCTLNKEKVIAFDIKTKARLNKWNAQGINLIHYNQYMNFVNNSKIPFYLVFIDDKIGTVHCADITNLKNPIYPNHSIIAWDICQMHYLFTIDKNAINELSKYDQRNYLFNPK